MLQINVYEKGYAAQYSIFQPMRIVMDEQCACSKQLETILNLWTIVDYAC